MNETSLASTGAPQPDPEERLDQPRLLCGALVQLFLFEGDRYLGWDCFDKDIVLVGGSPDDDLILEGMGDLGVRLAVYVDGDRLIVHNPSDNGRVRVNDEPVSTRVLGPLDVVTVGPYSAKIRLKRVDSGETWQPRAEEQEPRLSESVGKPAAQQPEPEGQVILEPPGRLADASPLQIDDCPKTAPLNAIQAELGTGYPPGLEDPQALELFDVLMEQVTVSADAGARYAVQVESAEAGPTEAKAGADAQTPWSQEMLGEDTRLTRSAPGRPTVVEPPGAPVASAATAPVEAKSTPARPDIAWSMPSLVYVPDDEPDEDEEDDQEAGFSLVDLVVHDPAPDHRRTLAGSLLQVAHSRGDNLLDLSLLDAGAHYRHPDRDCGGRKMVRRDKQGRSYLLLSPEDGDGQLTLKDGTCVPLRDLLTRETLVSRRKQLHRIELPRGARAELQIGRDRVILTTVPRRDSPLQVPSARRNRGLVRHLATSSLFHVLVLMVGSLFLSLPSPEEPPPPETRFVQLDPEQLKPPAPKPAVAPKPKPAPVQVAVAPQAKPKPKPVKPKPAPKKSKPGKNPALASTKGKGPGSAAASPKAGGGHDGTALNRNIKKTGILGALGIPDGIKIGANEAMAAVTNLDAVASTRSSEAALKVGGIVGSLGSDRVEMPAVGLVNTKGSTQVAVSAGIGGEGSVAALERGRTGETQVRAMVTADIKAPVNVSGGMSREEVKRVIDAHIDEVSYCYETALIEDPGLMGRMAFEWKILMTGRVGEVNIQSSSIQSDTLHACIKRAIHTWQFPEPRGAEVLVSYPFVFDVVGF